MNMRYEGTKAPRWNREHEGAAMGLADLYRGPYAASAQSSINLPRAGHYPTQGRGRRRAGPRAVLCGALVGLFAVLAACGYRHQAVYPEQVSTVAVINFGNRAYYQGVEFSLTEAVKKEIEWRTPYKITGRDRADTILTGEIIAIRQNVLSRRREGGLPQDLEYRIIVNFEWKDQRSGDVLRKRVGMEVVAPFQPARPVGQPLTLGEDRAVQFVAERVVAVMKADL